MSEIVLVVAGDPLFAKGIERAFQKEGLEVVVADEAETALVALEFEKPAAVIVENDLRDKPGSQLARDIRGRDEGNGIPLVLLAGAMMPAAELAPRVFSAGVTACIDSTVDPVLLAQAMKLRLAGDPDALGRLARGEFVAGAALQEEGAAENSVTELDDAASNEASIAEAQAGTGAPVAADDPAPADEPAPVKEERVWPPAKPRSGSLGDISFGELLCELHRDHATGVLDLSREKVKKSIWLKDGVATYAKSNAMGETLGAVLVKMGKITEAQRLTSMEVMQKEKRKHGDVLVEMGLIKPKDVTTALQAQARAKVINCFAWDDGIYRFVPTDELPDDMPSLKMSFGSLVAAGVKQRYDLPRLRKALLPHIGETPRFQDSREPLLDEMKLEAPQRDLIAQMRGRRSLAEVLALSDMDEEDLHRLIVTALFAGVVRFYPEGPVTMQMRLGREEIEQGASELHERLRTADGDETSEPAATSEAREDDPEESREEIAPARARRAEPDEDDDEKPEPSAAEFDLGEPEPTAAEPDAEPEPEPEPEPVPRRVLAPPPVIADEEPMPEHTVPPEPPRGMSVEDELKSFLENDDEGETAPGPRAKGEPPKSEPAKPEPSKRRNRFDDLDERPSKAEPSMSEPTAPPRGDPDVLGKIEKQLSTMQKQNYYERLGVAVGAPEAAIKSAYLRLAKEFHPDRLVTEGGAGVKDKADQLFALVSEAYHTLTDAAKRKKYDDEVIHGKMSDEAASDEAEAILNAEHQFLKGERLLKAGNFAKAFESFKAAVDLYPKEAEYQACYGFTMFKVNHPANGAKAAEGEKIVETARKSSPKNDKILYFLGSIAKAKGDNDAARTLFEKALAIQPDNVDAQRELRVMDMRDSKNKGISGLFGGGRKK